VSRQRLDEIGQYTIVPKWVQRRLKKEPFALQVYAWLGTYANRDAEAWPKRERLAGDLEVSVRSIGRALETLRALGCIETKLRHNPANGAVIGMMFTLRQVEPVDDLLQDITDLKDTAGLKDTRGPKGDRQRDKSGAAKGTQMSPLVKEELDPSNQIQRDRAPEVQDEPKPPAPAQVVIAKYCEAWKARYGVKADVSPADRGQAKRIAEDPEYQIADVLAALEAYIASNDPYYVPRRHPLALFCTNVGKLIAGLKAKPAPGASIEDRLEQQRLRDERIAQLRRDAAAAIAELEPLERDRIMEIAEITLAHAHPDLKKRVTEADWNKHIAERAVQMLIENGRGRTMAATLQEMIAVEVAS
jgi:helix-turn-helix protein